MIPKKRYDTNAQMEKFCAYRRAWDVLMFYGKKRNLWDSGNLSKADADEVWNFAIKDFDNSL